LAAWAIGAVTATAAVAIKAMMAKDLALLAARTQRLPVFELRATAIPLLVLLSVIANLLLLFRSASGRMDLAQR
jgi:hypothetical protein